MTDSTCVCVCVCVCFFIMLLGLCMQCWETVIGQKFYANAVVNIIASVIGTIVFDALQK